MRDFFDDLKYMCSADNTTSRGIYIVIAIALVLLPIASITGFVAFAMRKVVFSLILGIVAILLEVGLVIWLKKS